LILLTMPLSLVIHMRWIFFLFANLSIIEMAGVIPGRHAGKQFGRQKCLDRVKRSVPPLQRYLKRDAAHHNTPSWIKACIFTTASDHSRMKRGKPSYNLTQ